MKKVIVVMLCLTSLLLQGCWTTMTKENPQYADCSSYHNLSYPGGQQANYVTVVSASAGRCYGAGGDSVAHAKQAAMSICKSNSRQDCAVYAENKKIVLSPTLKNRDMDWDSTFTLLTLGMAGAVAYEAGKSEVPASGQYYAPQIQKMPSYPSNSSIGTLPSSASRSNTVPPAGSGNTVSAEGGVATPGETYVDSVNHCLLFQGGKVDGNASWFKLTNRCNFTIAAAWCDSRGERCSLSSASDIPPGGTDESWYLNTKYSGISRMACPAKHNGKTVIANDWRCKVMSW